MNAVLDVIDLNAAQQAIYQAVIVDQPVTLDRLARTTGASESELREAIEVLQLRGLVARSPGERPRYLAAPPDVALEALLLEQEERIKRARMFLHQLSEHHRRSVASRDPDRLVEVITGREAVLQRYRQTQQVARHELRAIDKPPYAVRDPLDNIDLEIASLSRGVRWRGIYDASGLETFHRLADDLWPSIAAGEEARVLPSAPTKLILADDRVGLIPLQLAPHGIDSIIVVYPSALLGALSALFEQLWERALPIPAPPEDQAESPGHPTKNELELLGLLTVGLPDDRIASHLGVSHRTLQRRVRALLDRLGARTRFQAGLRATALGWLPRTAPGSGDEA